MLRLRLAGAVLATVTALAGGGALAAGPASASPTSASAGYIDVEANSATSPPDNVGLLSVSLGSDSPITSMTVDIVPESGGSPLLSLPMSDFTVPTQDGTGYYGVWTLTSPITTAALAIGSYSVEVTAASADASISDVSAGTLNFLNEVSFPTFTSNGTTFSYDNQDVTFTGTATELAPGGTPVPFANEQLELTGTYGELATVTTAADGSFSVTTPANSQFFWMEYQGDALTAVSASSSIQITLVQFTAAITAAIKVQHAKYGQPDQVTGTLTYNDNGTTEPLAGTTVGLWAGYFNPGQTPDATAVTDSAGQFTMPVPTTVSQTWAVAAGGSQYFTTASTSVSETVAFPAYVGRVHASISAFALVRASGCIVQPSGLARLEYSARAHGPWASLGKLNSEGISCQYDGHSGIEYSGHFGAHLASAYYRIVNVGNDNSQAAVSSSVHLSRLFTKITPFSVSPRQVPSGGTFTVSGRLWAQNTHNKWRPDGGRKVLVIFKYQGTWYRYPHEPKTTSSGRFSWSFPVYDSTPVFAQYDGDATHFACATKRIHVTDIGAAAAAARPAGSRLAGAIPLAARIMAQLLAG
jgi:hypothetical protein